MRRKSIIYPVCFAAIAALMLMVASFDAYAYEMPMQDKILQRNTDGKEIALDRIYGTVAKIEYGTPPGGPEIPREKTGGIKSSEDGKQARIADANYDWRIQGQGGHYQTENQNNAAPRRSYIGLSIAQTVSVGGGMTAEYRYLPNAWEVPGSFRQSGFRNDGAMPIQFSIGREITDNLRVDISYLRYDGLTMPGFTGTAARAFDHPTGGNRQAAITGGDVSSESAMVNFYYDLYPHISLLGGRVRPYVGAGIGMARNVIQDYTVRDIGGHYWHHDMPVPGFSPPEGTLVGVSNIGATHHGGTSDGIAYAFEGGLTTELSERLLLDLFVRYAHLGRVETSGNVTRMQTEWRTTDIPRPGTVGNEWLDTTTIACGYANMMESGSLQVVDLGVRLRVMF